MSSSVNFLFECLVELVHISIGVSLPEGGCPYVVCVLVGDVWCVGVLVTLTGLCVCESGNAWLCDLGV